MNLMNKLKSKLSSLKTSIVHLNFFDSDRCRSDIFYLRSAIISTRVYLILLIVIVTSLAVTSTWSNINETIIIRQPNQKIYENLFKKYSRSLTCQCSQTAIPFDKFISIQVKYHPICSSFFISKQWIQMLYKDLISYYIRNDFRSIAPGHFQLLSSLCSLAQQTINETLNDFLSSTFLSVRVYPAQSFQIRIQERSTLVRISSANAIQRLVNLIRDTTFANQLQPALQTTNIYYVYVYPDQQIGLGGIDLAYERLNGQPCYCSQERCRVPAGFYNYSEYTGQNSFLSPLGLLENVTGFKAGCFAIDALLQSTLECFFDQKCLNTILKFYQFKNITFLNILSLNQTKFPSKTLIETLVNEIFIEQWLTESSFTAYYNQCAPISCIYTISERNNAVFVLATLTALCGGFMIVLRACVPSIVHWFRQRFNSIETNNSRRTSIFQRMHNRFIQFNIYKINRQSNDPYDIKTEFISTRIYFIILTLSIIIFLIFLSVPVQKYDMIIEEPSVEIFEELYKKYSTQLQCSCRRIIINYGSFISLTPKFHPICSSAYLSNEWIYSLTGIPFPDFENILDYQYDDFHRIGASFFSTVKTLCSMAESTYANSYLLFTHSALVTDYAMSSNELFIRMNNILNEFQSNTINEFKQLFSLIRFHTNSMLTSTRTNADMYTNQLFLDSRAKGEPVVFHGVPIFYGVGDFCICSITDQCSAQIKMYSNGNRDVFKIEFDLPNMFIGCFALQSVLQSSLECYFNQTCLDAVQFEIYSNSSMNISILDQNQTQHSPQTLFITLMNSLMIEDWGRIIEYNKYYNQCRPKFCSYSIWTGANAYLVFTKMFGSIGGLIIGWRLIVRIVVKQIRKWLKPTNQSNLIRRSIKIRLTEKFHRIYFRISNLNIYTKELTIDIHSRQRGIVATRLYILLLIMSITILIISTSIEQQIQHITHENPSKETYENLQSNIRYASTLECPCRHISISYREFISIKPHFHQLCTSYLFEHHEHWLKMVCLPAASLHYSHDDFRLFILPEFQYLFSLCKIANETLTDALTQFMSITLTSIRIETRQTIENHANESIFRFRLTTPQTFVRMLDYVRHIAQGNAIVSTILSNWYFLSSNQTNHGEIVTTMTRIYANCSCAINSLCTAPAFISNWRVPGFLVGCYPLEALLQSTLECLYDAECIQKLHLINYYSDFIMLPLNSTSSNPNVTVQSLLEQLMIDEWETDVNYENYYDACQPISCSYSITEQANIIYIIGNIIGLFGGLSVILKIITPIIVNIGYYTVRRRQQRQIQPSVSIITIQNE